MDNDNIHKGANRKKFLRRVLISALMIVVVLTIGITILLVHIDSIARIGIEKSMSRALQVPVTIGSVRVGIFRGEAQIRKLTIGNPESYKTPHALFFDQASARFDLASFRTEEPVIHEIVIQAPNITLEQGLTESNLSRLAKNASRFSGGKKSETAKPQAGETASHDADRAVKIERLVIDNGQVGVSAPVLQGKVVPILLPPIKLTDLGGKKGTPATAEALSRIFVAILEGVAQSGKGLLPGETLKSVQTSLGGIKAFTDDLKKGRDQLGGQLRTTGKKVNGLLKGLAPAKKDTMR